MKNPYPALTVLHAHCIQVADRMHRIEKSYRRKAAKYGVRKYRETAVKFKDKAKKWAEMACAVESVLPKQS